MTAEAETESGNAGGHNSSGSMVSLIHLLSREARHEKLEKPVLDYGHSAQSKKGEDFILVKTDCQRTPGDGSSTFEVFAIFDGHNGAAAAIYSKDNLLNDIMSAIPPGLSRDDWLAALPRALVAGFVKADKEFQRREQSSGTTATFVVIDGLTVTVASVGDSRCILDSEAAVTTLTVDHRLEVNEEERMRVTASGGEVGRLSTAAGAEVGPLRCWPGGLCLSRSIGDMDVGEFIVPIPYVKQIKVPATGGRLIIATDGVWDSLHSEAVVKCSRGLPAEIAAKQIVKEALRSRGLRDDTTCLVVDIIPPTLTSSSSSSCGVVAKKANKMTKVLKALQLAKAFHSSSSKTSKPNTRRVEELFEEGSAKLAERLASNDLNSVALRLTHRFASRLLPVHDDGVEGVLSCAICQERLLLTVSDGMFSLSGEGPFLCRSCKLKKDAMEGNLARVLPNPNAMDQ